MRPEDERTEYKLNVSPELIRQMIKVSDGDDFESMRSYQQELTFEEAEKAFKRYGVDFSQEKYMTLGLRDIHDGLYTQLALLLSDQCCHTIKVAVFEDPAYTIFKDAREFGGSLFRQLEDCYAYLSLANRTASTFEGLARIDNKDYPDQALREALLNAIVHRDYSFSGSIIINISDEAMEFISLGGLLPGLSVEDIKSGISQPRNRRLADVFHRLRLIESYGTGIRRLFSLYKGCEVKPRIEVTPNVFKLILPNMNHTLVSSDRHMLKEDVPSYGMSQIHQVLNYIHDHGEISEHEIQALLGVKRTRAYLIAREMVADGLIVCQGRGADKRYRLREQL